MCLLRITKPKYIKINFIYSQKIKRCRCKIHSMDLILKAFMFIIYRKQFHELHNMLESMFNEVLENSQLRSSALSMLNLFRLPAYMVFYLIMGTMGLYICTPIKIIVYESIKNVEPKHYGLPFPASFPWIDGTPGIIYQIQYFFEAQYIWFIIFLTGGIDSSYGLSLFQMAGILRAMSVECKNPIKSSSELENILRKCVKKQIKLLRCRDIIKNIYGPIILDLILTSAVVLCGLIFQAFQTEMSMGKILTFVVYGLLKTVQAFIYAWYGTIIAAEAEAFQQSVYCSVWYEYGEDLKLMKNILIILTQKPIVLVACNFVHISLDIFIKVINTSISYYFLLQTFDETITQ
ncbi:hypothetical protein KPH14_001755 [Odynerus spinipes]|uniref:Odorant receptor n=1 Tax=Odynerus spinipes TaxID=1348599 RepID=A0AAD9RZQ5_9HYME|nr:hypothetical protein KPH14_001755 [Odynerus spinipes]